MVASETSDVLLIHFCVGRAMLLLNTGKQCNVSLLTVLSHRSDK